MVSLGPQTQGVHRLCGGGRIVGIWERGFGFSPIAHPSQKDDMTPKFWAAVARVRKAIVAVVSVAVIGVLHKAGIQIDNDTITIILDSLAVSAIVWAVPNANPSSLKGEK